MDYKELRIGSTVEQYWGDKAHGRVNITTIHKDAVAWSVIRGYYHSSIRGAKIIESDFARLGFRCDLIVIPTIGKVKRFYNDFLIIDFIEEEANVIINGRVLKLRYVHELENIVYLIEKAEH